jgi:hypothetical protein
MGGRCPVDRGASGSGSGRAMRQTLLRRSPTLCSVVLGHHPPPTMDDNSGDRLTLARRFLEPSNPTHRQYEALRAFFVDGLK